LSSDKCPPQFVFEMITAQTARAFLSGSETSEETAARLAEAFADLYDTTLLADDLIKAIERILVFIESVNISDVDLLFESFIYFTANFENPRAKRNKAPLFGGLLKGRPRDPTRALTAARNFSTYAFAIGQGKAPRKPEDWTPESEKEMEPVMSRLFPKAEPASA
jgi:hypothetical protein